MEFALVDVQLEELIKDGCIAMSGAAAGGSDSDREVGRELLRRHVQPASLDLPVGSECLLMRDKVLPHRRTVARLLEEEDFVLERKAVDPVHGVVLLKGQTYLFPCAHVALRPGQRGSLSPKSSIGRVDLMVRGIFDGCGLYDTVHGSGELWMEVSPRSFNVRVHALQALSQLMVFEAADPAKASSELPPPPPPLSPAGLATHTLCFDENGAGIDPPAVHRDALVLSLNLKPSAAAPVVGFEALPTSAVVDLGKVGQHEAQRFFRPIVPNVGTGSVTLEKDKFYILATKERVAIPLHLSAEMVPFSQHVGELRAHYAGFFDPGFGYGAAGEIKGTIGVLEVRPHETITVYHGQPICLMQFFNNCSTPRAPYGHLNKNNYQEQQGPKLAKFFAESKRESITP